VAGSRRARSRPYLSEEAAQALKHLLLALIDDE
jgi:hypothetical protein